KGSATEMHVVLPRLMAYGQALEYDSKMRLAADVYRTVVSHAHPIDDGDVAVSAHIRLAYCLLNAGELDEAAATYGQAERVANAVGDVMGVLRARIGEARVATERGNMPRAESILDETIERAAKHGVADVHSRALHERARVAGLRGEYERSIQLAYDALELTTSSREKDRILGDVAASFLLLGLLDVARDAYLV